MTLTFCFISATRLVEPSDLYVLARRIEINAAHCASVWGFDPPAIEVFADERKLPDGCVPVVFYESVKDGNGALADHDWSVQRHMPAARVMVGAASGLLDGDYSVSESASHEVLEACVDPACDLWLPLPGRHGVEVAKEACDTVQDDYRINEARCANFVTPDYFRESLASPEAAAAFLAAGGKFDWLGTLKRAGDVGPEGYLLLRQGERTWTEAAGGAMAARKRPGAMDPWARTERRIAQTDRT